MTMGLMDRLGFGGDDDDDEMDGIDVGDEFEEDMQDEAPDFEEGIDDDPVEEEEDEMMEWDSAYRFCEWYLEDEGFANMRDFGEKAMMYRLQNSDKYRDRIENGLRTLSMINDAKSQLDQISGDDGGSQDT